MSLNAFYNYVEKENRNSPVHTFEASFWHNITKGQRITLGGKLVLRPQYNERNLQKRYLGMLLDKKRMKNLFISTTNKWLIFMDLMRYLQVKAS